MFSRLLKILETGKKRPLTDAEIKEAAHEINRPLLEPLLKPLSPGFVSSRKFGHTDVVERIKNISWFSGVGNSFSGNLSAQIKPVENWEEAVRCCREPESENAQLESQNQLTLWLSKNARDEYRKWNDAVRKYKASGIDEFVTTPVRAYCEKNGVDDIVIQNVKWDLLGALMENEYLYTGHEAFFFLELLEVYEAGHFPCGWQGKWPEGRICVL